MDKKVVATNRKARRNYQLFERLEVGIALRGDEVKSLRQGKCSIDESFARPEKGELFLYNMHISEFEKSSYFKSQPKRPRKLLLHRREISHLIGLISQKGYTLIPLQVYFNEKNIVKVELALAKGRRAFDKRRKIKEEYQKREVQRQIKRYWSR